MAKASIRMSADERRESVVKAAIIEFARGGYASTSTAAIASRVGVSQPYLFRLFPDKRAIFLAAARRCTDEIRLRFAEVSEGLPPEEAGEAMADAYAELIADRDRLLFQMQMYVAAATAEVAGDAAFGAEVRAAWTELWELVHLRLGSNDRTGDFIATGMLINVLLAMGFPQDHRVWSGCGLAGDRPELVD
jgi:AcrR family transcriptional regulator